MMMFDTSPERVQIVYDDNVKDLRDGETSISAATPGRRSAA